MVVEKVFTFYMPAVGKARLVPGTDFFLIHFRLMRKAPENIAVIEMDPHAHLGSFEPCEKKIDFQSNSLPVFRLKMAKKQICGFAKFGFGCGPKQGLCQVQNFSQTL